MRRTPVPATESACFRLATSYLARRSASRFQLRRYLLRTLGPVEDDAPATQSLEAVVDAVLTRLERLQMIDDTSLAQARARTLARKGFAGRRMTVHLAHQGFDVTDPSVAPSLAVDDDAQAIRYAERKRLGPFAVQVGRSTLERDVRILVRAGFAPDLAIRVMKRLHGSRPQTVHDDLPEVNEP